MFDYVGKIPAQSLLVSHQESEPRSWWQLEERHGGDAPDWIKDDLMGVPMPVRYVKREGNDRQHAIEVLSRRPYVIENAIWFRARDVIKALVLTRHQEAAEFWHDNRRSTLNFNFEFERGSFVPTEHVYGRLPLFRLFDCGAIDAFTRENG